MAAFDTPWTKSMAPSSASYGPPSPGGMTSAFHESNPPTTAAFSPTQSVSGSQRRTVLVHQHSALLSATPPQVTRTLAFSHPFLLPLSKLIGLISWSGGDPWESFLVVCSFWALVLFGGDIIKWSGPILAAAALVAGMWSRRFSPLSTNAVVREKERSKSGDSSMRHQKSLDEIVETLNIFTARCNILLDPLLELTDFLSTQQTATSATTRPALTTLLLRLLMTLPLWVALTLPPLRLITAQRVVLLAGTLFLTWHARPARIARTVLWRSLTVRHAVSLITGLSFSSATTPLSASSLLGRRSSQHAAASTFASSRAKTSNKSTGAVRFTFTVYENQRRWLGLGWTSAMFAYERAAWTDEHLNPAATKEKFPLPAVEGGAAKWRWVLGSEWHTEGGQPGKGGDKAKNAGWVYYDNKWQDPRRADGWGRYTRRRKWYRDGELVDVDPDDTATDTDGDTARATTGGRLRRDTGGSHVSKASIGSKASVASTKSAKSQTGAAGRPAELPASTPLASSIATVKPSTSPTTKQTLLSHTAATAATGTDATDFASSEKTTDDAASMISSKSMAGSTGTSRRRGLFRRTKSRDDRGSAGSEKGPGGDEKGGSYDGKDGVEDDGADARSTRSTGERDEEEDNWLVGDDVKMGLG